ncbi:hypothetical protein [Roseovarius aquimarinus]|uniref:EF-hand domain-containing protein n=1 Tax=Roseovarius aquimarinus TaxID=1229156 RepID=A0ABW7I6F0_9RHOB
MKRIITPVFASATLMAAVPAIAATDAESDMMAVCDGALMEADKNADGKMSGDEIDALANARFEQIDGNDDGSINREEFVSCMMGERKAEQEKAAAGETDGTYEVGKWSDLSDSDKMSAAEYGEVAEKAWSEGDEKMKNATARMDGSETESAEGFANAATQRFKSHDTNGDGVITQAEYERPATEAEFDEKALERQFDEKDADNSGAISPQEYRSAATWAHGAMGADKASEAAQGSDDKADDKDGDETMERDAETDGVSVVRYYILTY